MDNAEIEQRKLMEAEQRVSGGERKILSFGKSSHEGLSRGVPFLGRINWVHQCWKDKAFLDWVEKRFGDLVKIKSVSGNIVV